MIRQWSESLLQLAEPFCVGPPLVDPVTVDWLTDLFRASGFHCARIAMEIEAGWIEW